MLDTDRRLGIMNFRRKLPAFLEYPLVLIFKHLHPIQIMRSMNIICLDKVRLSAFQLVFLFS